ncbi:MAG: tetratricopeptide repeat protein [Armatimonadota bacterium]
MFQLGRVEEQRDEQQAEVFYEESMALYRQVGERRGLAIILIQLGLAAMRRSNYAAAKDLLEQGLALGREQGNKQSTARALSGLGTLAGHRGDHDRARKLCKESLATCREIRDDRQAVCALELLAAVEALADSHGERPCCAAP